MRTNRYELTKGKKKQRKQAPVEPADLDALLDAREQLAPAQPEPTPAQQQVVLG